MYIPAADRMEDEEKAFGMIERYGFATVVTDGEGGPWASHVPMLLDRGARELRGHLARANGQWRRFGEGREVLSIFHGPHGYISPTWYAVGPAVPTWNYAVVHVYGVARIEEDPEVVRGIVAAMAAQYETGRERPWGMEALPREMQDAMLRAIVGFSVAITRIETKFKLGANRSAEDQEGMIRALGASGMAGDRELGELMERERDERERGR